MKDRVSLSSCNRDWPLLLFAPMLWLIIAFLIAPYFTTSLRADQESLDRADVVRTVLRGLADNDRALGAVQVDLLEISEQPGVAEERIVTERLPSGAIVSRTESPFKTTTARATLDGNKCRYDYLDTDGAVRRTIIAEGERWSEYQPDRRALIVRRLDQMAGLLPLDPRESGVYDIRLRIVPTLRDGVVQSATRLKTSDGDREVYRVVVQDTFGQTLEMDFSEDLSFMPVSTSVRAPGGSVLRHTQMEYEKIEDRNAWLLKRATTRYLSDRTTRDPQAANWSVAVTRVVTDVTLLGSAAADEAFKLQLPEGIRVHDLTELHSGEPTGSSSSGFELRLRIGGLLFAGAIASGWCAYLIRKGRYQGVRSREKKGDEP